jgi:hypothetical protein
MSSADGIVAVSCVLLTNVVLSEIPFTWTTEVLRNPVPFTVSIAGPDPAATLVGLIEVMVGTADGVLPPPPLPEPLPELDDPPPQPGRKANTPRPRTRTKPRGNFIG